MPLKVSADQQDLFFSFLILTLMCAMNDQMQGLLGIYKGLNNTFRPQICSLKLKEKQNKT